MKVGIYPGSFDPVTVGHLDVIRRSAALFESLVVAVGANVRKDSARSSAGERASLLREVVGGMDNVTVEEMSGLLVDFARKKGARVVVKGLRTVSDFESEYEQAQLNRRLSGEIETVFIASAVEHSYLSSSAVREIAFHGGEVRGMVPDIVLERVKRMYSGSEG